MDQQSPASRPQRGPARPLVAFLWSLAAPGLALVYTGRLVAGLIVNLLFLLVVLLFVIAAVIVQFFPLYPALVLLAAWLTFCMLSSWHAAELIDDDRHHRQRFFQHPLIYALIALLTFLAPLAATGHFTARHLLTVIPVEHEAMAPQYHPGDWLVIDRTAFQDDAPTRGDIVVVRMPGDGERSIARVVASPTDNIQMQGYTLVINDDVLEHTSVEDDNNDALVFDDDAELWVEHNHESRYVISVESGSLVDSSLPDLDLGDDQYFLLSDNRSFVNDDERPFDSRAFGTVTEDHIEGRPLYVAWSTLPDSSGVNWERIGLRAD